MKEEWLLRGAAVPVTCETVTALVNEIKRLIDVIGGMALAQPDHIPDARKMVAERTWVELTDEEVIVISNYALTCTMAVHMTAVTLKGKNT